MKITYIITNEELNLYQNEIKTMSDTPVTRMNCYHVRVVIMFTQMHLFISTRYVTEFCLLVGNELLQTTP